MLADLLSNELINNLSKNDHIILEYIYNHPNQLAKMTIREFADLLAFSPTTIFRFCKKLNLTGFNELKYIVQESEIKKSNNSDFNQNEDNYLKNMSEDIENTLSLIKEAEIKEAIAEFNSDKNIHIFGGGGLTGNVLEYMEKLFFSYGRQRVFLYETNRLAFHVANKMNKADLLIVISASGTFEPTVKLTHIAKMRSATVLAITPYTKNPIAKVADINFRFFGNIRTNKEAEFSLRLPIFYLIHTLFMAYFDSQRGDE